MTSNFNYSKEERKKFCYMSPPNNKMMNKRVTLNFFSYKKDQILPSKPINNISSNLYNNHIVYQSFNRNGYNGIVDPSLSGNNNILIINNSEKDSQNIINISPKKQKRTALYKNSKNNKFEQIQNPNIPNNGNDNKINSFSKSLQTNSNSIVSKENPSNKNYSKWNNIGFREIKCKRNNGVLSYEINTTKNKNSYKSNQEFSSSIGQNGALNNDNLRRSNNTNISANNQTNSSRFFKQSTNPVMINTENRILKFKNAYSNKNQNEAPKTYRQDSNTFNTNDKSNNNRISKNTVIINNLKSPKKNKNNFSNPYQNMTLNSDYKRKTETKKPKNEFNNNFISKRKNIYKNTTEKDTNKDKDKEKTSNANNSNSLTLRQYYKNVTQKQKSFPINIKESNNLNYLRNKNTINNHNKNNINIPNEEYIKKVYKIQSLWKGKYVRKLMSYYWNLDNFKNILESVIVNHVKQQFFNKIKLKKNKKDNPYDKDVDDYNKIKKDLEELKRNKKKKDKDYNKLLEKYNSIVKKFDELKKKNDENEKIIISKSNIKNNDNNDNGSKVFEINNNYLQINNNNKKTKKFDEIKKEKKEELNIISNNNQDNNIKLRAQRPKKQEENHKKILLIENGTQLDWKDYTEDLSNLEIINIEQFFINQKEVNNHNNKNKSMPTYEIINYNLTLVTHNKAENPKILKICKNKSFNILNNSIKSSMKSGNESLIISNNYETSTSLSTKENKKYNELNLSPENQNNLNLEIKGVERQKTSSKEYFIEQQKNGMAIFGGEKYNIFNKECLIEKSDISMNILSQRESLKEIDKNIKKIEDIKENDEDFENYANYENEKDDKGKKANKNIEIYKNERFCLINSDISSKKNLNNNSENLIIDNKENNSLLNKDKNLKNNDELIICDNDKLNIEGKNTNKCDQVTEITNEINIMEPDNHYQLIFNPTNIKKESGENGNNKKVEFENEINIESSMQNEDMIENENKTILKKNQQFEIINKIENNIPGIITNSNENKKSKNKNYNLVNEIEKGDALEINPFEMRRTQNNNDNIFISNENKIEFLNNKESIYSDKAKKNMMRIILPIKMKSIIREKVKKMAYKYLIHNLKEMKKN